MAMKVKRNLGALRAAGGGWGWEVLGCWVLQVKKGVVTVTETSRQFHTPPQCIRKKIREQLKRKTKRKKKHHWSLSTVSSDQEYVLRTFMHSP